MPSPLELLQKQFTSSVIGEADPALVVQVRGGGALTPAEAVEIYRRGYPARMSEALGETFEACWRVLGDEDFLKACEEYSRSVKSISHNLSDYGHLFPEFLQARFHADAPFIGSLATFEWAFKEIFHAAPHTPLSPSDLAREVKDNSVLIFGPSVKLLPLTHSVVEIWKRDRSDGAPLIRSQWDAPQGALLYKSGGTPVFSRVIAAPEASALRSLMAQQPLSEALAAASGLTEAAARNLFSFLSEAGLIVAVRQP